MTTVAVRLPDELVQRLDQLVAQGRYATRTEAVRRALVQLADDAERAEIDRAIVEGYRRSPPPEPTGADDARADRSIAAESW